MTVAQKLKHLLVQKRSILSSSAAVQSGLKFARECLKKKSDEEIMCMHSEIQDRLQGVMEEHHKERKYLVPVEVADMEVELSSDDMKELCQNKAVIGRCTIDCDVTGEGAETAKVSEISKFKVTVKSSDASTLTADGAQFMRGRLKSLKSGLVIECDVYPTEENQYSIMYTPKVQGPHELTLTLNGHQLSRSPLSVLVSIQPSQLNKPVTVIDVEAPPRNIATNSAGELIVTYRGMEEIVVLDQKGKKIRSSFFSDYGSKVEEIQGLAIDKANNDIYLAGYDSALNECVILKLTQDLKLSNVLKLKQRICAIEVVANEVMMCEANVINAYTKELQFVNRVISIPNTHDLCSNEQGILYASMNSQFQKIPLIPSKTYRQAEWSCSLNSPWGVCAANEHVYVVNQETRNVSIYTTVQGYGAQQLTTFGGKYRASQAQQFVTVGENPGTPQARRIATFGENLNSPCGVCIDKFGFVYVCDEENKIIVY